MKEFHIPYGKQSIEEDDIKAVLDTLKAPFLTQGPKIAEFEKKFAEYVGAKYAVAVNNATAGLHIACIAVGLEAGQRVITSPITFAASANCARFCGAEVWFADIDRDTYLISLEATRKLIESKPQGFFHGIIPVDFGGLPLDLESFRQLSDEHNLWIIEDACHAPGGYFIDSNNKKQLCGNAIYSDCAVFSFHPVKHIACGEGGMITTDSETLYKKLKLYRSHGITKDGILDPDGGWYYEMFGLGFNYRITDIQCALGITQLDKNDKGLKRRKEIAEKYISALSDKYKIQKVGHNVSHAYHLFIIESDERKTLYDYLRSHNIFAQIHYIPIHTLSYYKKIGYKDANLSESEDYYSKCLSIPMYPGLTDKEQDYVIEKLLQFSV
ncbi:MAG: UDP-4-amino-4,6-dideoxy-N-acetyl-beta-L-altrosamine transaminase [Bacteroidia bacterium]|nr:UDP-4-amino-4,6-dideoxy-N-acetyl-beta-L-altrosamine transaminase [Bacteroidia bacterium]